MDETAIQSRLNALSDAMLAKGLAKPDPQFTFKSHRTPLVFIQYADARETYGTAYHVEQGDTPAEAFANAEAYIAAMPDAEQRKLHEFMGALGKVIDLGRENGIEVSFVNPLVETMKRLSENIITHQPA